MPNLIPMTKEERDALRHNCDLACEEFDPTPPPPVTYDQLDWLLQRADDAERLEARVQELQGLLTPEVQHAAEMIARDEDQHPAGCCGKCRRGLAERDRLAAALRRHGHHDDGCPAWPRGPAPWRDGDDRRGHCDCRLAAALRGVFHE